MKNQTAVNHSNETTEVINPARLAKLEAKAPQQFTPLELETRATVDTAAYAYHMGIAQQTARIHACKQTGPIRPIRIPGMAKLHWPVAEIKRVLGVK
jgi:hypothetical protein